MCVADKRYRPKVVEVVYDLQVIKKFMFQDILFWFDKHVIWFDKHEGKLGGWEEQWSSLEAIIWQPFREERGGKNEHETSFFSHLRKVKFTSNSKKRRRKSRIGQLPFFSWNRRRRSNSAWKRTSQLRLSKNAQNPASIRNLLKRFECLSWIIVTLIVISHVIETLII